MYLVFCQYLLLDLMIYTPFNLLYRNNHNTFSLLASRRRSPGRQCTTKHDGGAHLFRRFGSSPLSHGLCIGAMASLLASSQQHLHSLPSFSLLFQGPPLYIYMCVCGSQEHISSHHLSTFTTSVSRALSLTLSVYLNVSLYPSLVSMKIRLWRSETTGVFFHLLLLLLSLRRE